MKKIILSLLSVMMVLSLCACTKKEEPKEEVPAIAGKTYYDTSDLTKKPSKVWFGKDGSFVLTDEYAEGFDEMSGSYAMSENVVKLNVDSGGEGKYTQILFEVKNDETIVLRTSLSGSKNQALYSIHEPEVNIVTPAPAEAPATETTTGYKTFFNASQKKGVSYLLLHEDKSFNLVDTNGTETIEVNGLYGKEGDIYMFSNFDPFEDAKGSKIYNFEFKIMNDDVLILQRELRYSSAYDVFSIDGKIPVMAAAEEDPFKDVHKTTTWIRENTDELNEAYLPSITIAADYSFKFIENCYSGMAEIYGYCQKTDTGWACDVLDNTKMQGYKGDDVGKIVFEENKDGDLVLKTELCMSMAGDLFKKK